MAENQAGLDELKRQVAELVEQNRTLVSERDALKAASAGAAPDLEGLKNNRDKILTELKTERAEFKKVQAELDRLKTEKEEANKKALLEQEKYKELWELEQKKVNSLSTKIQENEKISKFKDLAILNGVNPGMLRFVIPEINQIEFDDQLNPKNAEAFFASFKETYPTFFQSDGKSVTVPATDSSKTNLTGTGNRPFTREEITGMSVEEFKKNEVEIDRQNMAGLIK